MALDNHDTADANAPRKGVWKSGKGKGRSHTKGRQLQEDAWMRCAPYWQINRDVPIC